MTSSRANQAALALAVFVSVVVAAVALQRWLAYDPASGLTANLPGRDGKPVGVSHEETPTDLTGKFQQFDGVAASLPGEWPRFRGPDFDNIYKEDYRLAESWGEKGPKILWSVDLGEGHSAPVVLDGCVYLIDYDEKAQADAIRCFSLADGNEIWRHSYSVAVKRNHGMSRTIPAVTRDYVVTMGPRCHVVCLDSKTGAYRWGISLQDKYGTTEPLWYTGQCPLIEEGLVILAPGGPDALMIAVDCDSGEVVWRTPNPNKWEMSHSSIIPMALDGVKMYVYCAIGGVTGVAASGAEAGKILWEAPWDAKVIAPSPVPLDDGRIFLTAGYGNGSLMLQLVKAGEAYTAETVFKRPPKQWLACEQQTPIYYSGLLHGIMPKDAGALSGQFVCYQPDGDLVWSSGPANRFGLGPFVLADDKFYALSDDGVLTVMQQSNERYMQLSQTKILDGHDAWGPIAIAGSRMLMRDSMRLVCIDASVDDEEQP